MGTTVMLFVGKLTLALTVTMSRKNLRIVPASYATIFLATN